MITPCNSAAALLRLTWWAEGFVPVLVNSAISLLSLPRRAAVALATPVSIVVRNHGATAKQSATGDQQHKNGFHGSFLSGILDLSPAYRAPSGASVKNREHAQSVSIPNVRAFTVIAAIVAPCRGHVESVQIASVQPERPFVGRRDAEPEKCAAGNGNGKNGSHWSAIGLARWGQTGYQHRPISNAKNSQQNTEVFA